MSDLFERSGGVLPMEDAELEFFPCWLAAGESQFLLDTLLSDTPWRQDSITLFGKTVPQPRLTAWYGEDDAIYQYSGLRLEPLPWTSTIQSLKERVSQACAVNFNSVLLNLYRNERDSMGMHADDEPELGKQPVIASLSLGAPRILQWKHRQRKGLGSQRLLLEDGSLLVMRGNTQRCWKHGINKQRTPCGPRINLTFRCIESNS